MQIRALTDRQIWKNLKLEKDKIYEVLDIVQDCYKIAIPMKHKGKFQQVLIAENEGELID